MMIVDIPSNIKCNESNGSVLQKNKNKTFPSANKINGGDWLKMYYLSNSQVLKKDWKFSCGVNVYATHFM
jgi:hypothetical protein